MTCRILLTNYHFGFKKNSILLCKKPKAENLTQISLFQAQDPDFILVVGSEEYRATPDPIVSTYEPLVEDDVTQTPVKEPESNKTTIIVVVVVVVVVLIICVVVGVWVSNEQLFYLSLQHFIHTWR